MVTRTRKLIEYAFSGAGLFSIFLLCAALLILLAPIAIRGIGAFLFKGTIEFRRLVVERFERGNRAELERELKEAAEARRPVYELIAQFERDIQGDFARLRKYGAPLRELKERLRDLLGPFPGEPRAALMRHQYGQTRWDRALVKLQAVLYVENYDYSDPRRMGRKVLLPRVKDFEGTSLEPLFKLIEANAEKMLRPRWTFYWRFLFDESYDAHFFGGVWPELLGTLYLALGAMIFAMPMGVISAVYLAEYAKESWMVGGLRTFISTLAGVPSIVFGLFGLAFFINTLHVSSSKSVLAGSLTLALLILPTIIRSSEEAIRSVPMTYREAALSLGASQWQSVLKVVLPAALPGILTGSIISLGRAAGETAPIIFTAAVSVGRPLKLWQVFSHPTPALSWNIYNLCTEHEAVDEIRHVQFGMVLTLVLLVLLMNAAALLLRARLSRKLKI